MFRRLIIAVAALLLPLIMVTAAAAASASVASQPGAVAPAVAANYFYGGYAVNGMTSVPGMPVAIYNS